MNEIVSKIFALRCSFDEMKTRLPGWVAECRGDAFELIVAGWSERGDTPECWWIGNHDEFKGARAGIEKQALVKGVQRLNQVLGEAGRRALTIDLSQCHLLRAISYVGRREKTITTRGSVS